MKLLDRIVGIFKKEATERINSMPENQESWQVTPINQGLGGFEVKPVGVDGRYFVTRRGGVTFDSPFLTEDIIVTGGTREHILSVVSDADVFIDPGSDLQRRH